MRVLLFILLLLNAFIVLVAIGAGSHGNISMQNKETAFLVYAATLFFITAISNGFYAQWKHSKTLGISSFILNLISGIIVSVFLITMFNPFLGKEIDLLVLIVILAIEIVLIIKLVTSDISKFKKSYHNR